MVYPDLSRKFDLRSCAPAVYMMMHVTFKLYDVYSVCKIDIISKFMWWSLRSKHLLQSNTRHAPEGACVYDVHYVSYSIYRLFLRS